MPRVSDEALSGKAIQEAWRSRVTGSTRLREESEPLVQALAWAQLGEFERLLPVLHAHCKARTGELLWPGWASDLKGVDLSALMEEAAEVVSARAETIAVAVLCGREFVQATIPPRGSPRCAACFSDEPLFEDNQHYVWQARLMDSRYTEAEQAVLSRALLTAQAVVFERQVRLPGAVWMRDALWWLGHPSDWRGIDVHELLEASRVIVRQRAFGGGRRLKAPPVDEVLRALRAG
jgi:hypothetical protein